MHILILGGSGFVGSRLARRFARTGAMRIDSLSSRECNLADPTSVALLQHKITPDTYVLFCSTVSRLREDSLRAFHLNVAMAENIATAARSSRALVFCSSIDVYGRPPSETPINEWSQVKPAGYYGLAKFVSERILQAELGDQVPLAILRLPGIYSLDEQDNSILGTLYARLKYNQTIELSGGGTQVRTYLHIDELHSVIESALLRHWSGLLTLGSSRSFSIRESVVMMRQQLGSTSQIVASSGNGSEFDIRVESAILRREFPEFVPRPLDVYLGTLTKSA